jgi:hypothetical protein
MSENRSTFQLVWGIALLLAGLGVFYRIPQVMPKILSIEQFASAGVFIRIAFYIIGGILIGGGAQKIFRYFKQQNAD